MRLIPTLILSTVLIGGCSTASPRSGKVLERWETTNRTFKMRVTAYGEQDWRPAPAGAYYVFESARATSDNWKEIMVFKHDDPVKIPQDQLRFVTDKIGYVFMVYQYSVTTDGGESWSTWDIVKDLPDWQRGRAVIEQVQLREDGVGTMALKPFTSDATVTNLRTQDYGRHWQIQ